MNTRVNKNRLVLLMIAGVPVMIILAASWLWYYVSSGRIDLVAILGTANRGELLSPPLALADFAPRTAAGDSFEIAAAAPPIWRILIPGEGSCDEACRQTLYYTRQINTAMGKYANRIERVYLAAAERDAGLAEELAQTYPDLKVLYTAPASMASLGSDADGQMAGYFVVDPAGWIILSYAADADGKDVMADLKFLIKNSGG
ncbi:MAG: hypothetical protein ABJ308_12905 [Halieaceae bacterium]